MITFLALTGAAYLAATAALIVTGAVHTWRQWRAARKLQARPECPPAAPAPSPHGGHLAAVDIWACGRAVTLNTETGAHRERPGRSMCPDCHPVPETDWDAALREIAP